MNRTCGRFFQLFVRKSALSYNLIGRRMVLDINYFRKEKGGDPEKIKENQRKRFKDDKVVDKIIELDETWRKGIKIERIE